MSDVWRQAASASGCPTKRSAFPGWKTSTKQREPASRQSSSVQVDSRIPSNAVFFELFFKLLPPIPALAICSGNLSRSGHGDLYLSSM